MVEDSADKNIQKWSYKQICEHNGSINIIMRGKCWETGQTDYTTT